jgi:hypothetical protein
MFILQSLLWVISLRYLASCIYNYISKIIVYYCSFIFRPHFSIGLAKDRHVFNPSVFFSNDDTSVFAARRDYVASQSSLWLDNTYISNKWTTEVLVGEFSVVSKTQKLQSLKIANFLPCIKPTVCGSNGTITAMVNILYPQFVY